MPSKKPRKKDSSRSSPPAPAANVIPFPVKKWQSIVFEYYHLGQIERQVFDTVEHALARAVKDYNDYFSLPSRIMEDGKTLMTADEIIQEWELRRYRM
jgi:hypothetical protein